MEAEQAEALQTSPLLQRLAHRSTQPGVINLSRYSTESTGLPGWIVQRSALVAQLQTRYSSRDSDAAGGMELALATLSPATDRVSRSPQVTSVGAIVPSTPVPSTPAPSTPLVSAAPVPSEPLLLSATASVIAPSPIAEPDAATFTTAPETIAPFNESIGEAAIASTQPTQQYRIRRVAANPTTPSATIQRKAASDESSAAIVPVSPVPSFHEAVSIAPEAPTRAGVNDSPSMADSAMPALDVSSPTSIAPISTLQPGEPTAQTTLVWRHALSDTPPKHTLSDTAAIASETSAQESLIPAQPASVEAPVARPLVQPTSLPAIVQRSIAPHPPSMVTGLGTGFSTQKPAAIAAVSMSALPLQPSLIWRSGADAVTNGVLQRHLQQRHIQPELPLAMSPVQGVQPAIARQTEMTGTGAIAAGTPPSLPTASSVLVPMPSGGVNVGQIAEQVSRILFRQLTVERERRGMSKWS